MEEGGSGPGFLRQHYLDQGQWVSGAPATPSQPRSAVTMAEWLAPRFARTVGGIRGNVKMAGVPDTVELARFLRVLMP